MDKANSDRPSRYDRWVNDWQGRHDIVLPREAYAELHKALRSEAATRKDAEAVATKPDVLVVGYWINDPLADGPTVELIPTRGVPCEALVLKADYDAEKDRADILAEKYHLWFERAGTANHILDTERKRVEAAENRVKKLARQIEELRGWDEVWRNRVDAAEADAAGLQREHAHLLNETGCGNFDDVIDALAKLTRERDSALKLIEMSHKAQAVEKEQIARIMAEHRAEAAEAEVAKAKSVLRGARTTLNSVVALDDEDAVEGSDLSASCQEVVQRIDAALSQEQRNG